MSFELVSDKLPAPNRPVLSRLSVSLSTEAAVSVPVAVSLVLVVY